MNIVSRKDNTYTKAMIHANGPTLPFSLVSRRLRFIGSMSQLVNGRMNPLRELLLQPTFKQKRYAFAVRP